MKDFICVSVMSHNKSALNSIFEHNENRQNGGEEIDYLLEEDSRMGNETISFSYHAVSSGTYAENLRNFYATTSKSKHYKDLETNFYFLENLRLEQLKDENKKDFQKKHLVEFVVSLSEEKAKEYLDSGIDISKGFEQYANDLKEKFSINTLCINIHKDEGFIKDNVAHHNIHAHLVAYNRNFNDKCSVLSNFRKRDFRQLQTLAQNSFNKVGLDFRRGVSKFKTKKVHQKRNDFIITKQNSELKKLRMEIEETNKRNKEVYNLLNQQKNQLKELRLNFEKDSTTYEMLSVNIKNLQKEEQEKRSEYRTLDEQLKVLKEKTKRQTQKIDDLEQFKQEIKQDLKEYLKEHTTKKDNKYYINNIQDFYLNLVDTFEFASNLNVKIEELEKLKNINEILKEHLQKANDKSEYLSEQIKKVDVLYVKIKKLIEVNNSLKDDNYLLNNFIKEKNLEAEFGKFKNQDYECSHDFEM